MNVPLIVVPIVVLASTARAQSTHRVSLSSVGAQSDGGSAYPSVSASGRFVAFHSNASNLVTSVGNGTVDVYVRDLHTGQTTRASVNSAGGPADGPSYVPSLSEDGRFVAFVSLATNLVSNDTNGTQDVFVHDRQTEQTSRVSLDSSGTQGNGDSYLPRISADGRYIAFYSQASNFSANDTNGGLDVFVHDRQIGQTTCASVDLNGVPAGGAEPSISADGRYVAFSGGMWILVPGETNGWGGVFVRDLQTGQTTCASVDPSGAPGNMGSMAASISANGRYVAFESYASNLVPGDTNLADDIFRRDLQTGHTIRVSTDSAGMQGNGDSSRASISADGLTVAFESRASDLVPGDTNAWGDAFAHDVQTGQTIRASVDSAGAQSAGRSEYYCAISADGRYVLFHSSAQDLVPDDTNGAVDVFMHDRSGVDRFVPFCFGDGSLTTPCPCAPPNFAPDPSGAPDAGCANSFNLSGARLTVSGSLVPDAVVLTGDIGPNYVGFAFLVKGNAQSASGIANGDGVRCVDGALIRFGGHNAGSHGANVGFWTYPNTSQTVPVSLATAQAAGQNAWYQLYYRNAAAFFCSPGTTNWTNGVKLHWLP